MGRNVTAMGLHVTDVGCEKNEGKKELKKHAATIHCSNTLSLLQRKITNALLYHAYKELMHKDEHEITVKQLCRLIGYQGNNHAAIKDAFKGLISTVIEWNLINDETGAENWTASSIIASVSLQGPVCYYAYSPRMKQLLHSPSMFGKIDLVIQSRFRSSYGLALYENCVRYRGLPHTKWFDMELFKKLMGVPLGKYDVFRDFKRRVLDKAVDEVNMYSDLVIATEYVREGRRVVRVRFKLKERAKKTRLGKPSSEQALPHPEGYTEVYMQQLSSVFGLTEEQIQSLLTTHSREFIQEKMALIQTSKPFLEGKVQNKAAYLLSAIKNNYQMPTKNPCIDMETIKREREWVELKRLVDAVRIDYAAYREHFIHTAIEKLPTAEKQVFMTAFLRFAQPIVHTILQLQRKKYSADNVLEAPQMKAQLRQFALRELDFLALPSLDEFVLNQESIKREAWQKLKSYDPDHPLLQFSETAVDIVTPQPAQGERVQSGG